MELDVADQHLVHAGGVAGRQAVQLSLQEDRTERTVGLTGELHIWS